MTDHIMPTQPSYQQAPWWWRFADPAPDFLKYLKEPEARVIIAAQIDNHIAAVKAQQAVLDATAAHLQAQEKLLTQMKNMLTPKREGLTSK